MLGAFRSPPAFTELEVGGAINTTLRFAADKQPLRLRTEGYGSRTYLLRDAVVFPQLKRKIVVVNFFLPPTDQGEAKIVLRRLGIDGEDEPGLIAYRDEPDYEIKTVGFVPPQYVTLTLPRSDRTRMIRFFLPDDPGAAEATTRIPALPGHPEGQVAPAPGRREVMRKAGREWMGGFIAAACRQSPESESTEPGRVRKALGRCRRSIRTRGRRIRRAVARRRANYRTRREAGVPLPHQRALGTICRRARGSIDRIKQSVAAYRERRRAAQPAWKRRMRRRWRI